VFRPVQHSKLNRSEFSDMYKDDVNALRIMVAWNLGHLNMIFVSITTEMRVS
jgi:hypothetical protein